MIIQENRPRILTWHTQGSYLYYLTQTNCIFYLPFKENAEEGYCSRTHSFTWGENVISVPAEQVRDLEFDCILFQSRKNYLTDQYEILTEEQRNLPRIFLEHFPPRESPTETRHIVDDPNILLVHVTKFNALMWNSNNTPHTVIEHGIVLVPNVHYTGELEKGIVVINNLEKGGRRLGYDIFKQVSEEIPLDLMGTDSEALGGLGEIRNGELQTFISRYRFFFSPIRYTSLSLAACEAMMTGLPIIGLATTEMAVTVVNDYSGYVHTDVDWLIQKMKMLLGNRKKAFDLSRGAKETAREKFNIKRFISDWENVFHQVSAHHHMMA
jgi:glycosyltransferase involved in cell wall biosynthesis